MERLLEINKYLFFIILLTFSILSCDQVDDRLKISNKSSRTIFYKISKDTTINISMCHINYNHDTIWTKNLVNFIEPESAQNESILGIGNAWKKFIEKSFPDSTLHLFIIDKEMLMNLNANERINSNDVLYRYDLHVKELEKMNWEITFPPTYP